MRTTKNCKGVKQHNQQGFYNVKFQKDEEKVFNIWGGKSDPDFFICRLLTFLPNQMQTLHESVGFIFKRFALLVDLVFSNRQKCQNAKEAVLKHYQNFANKSVLMVSKPTVWKGSKQGEMVSHIWWPRRGSLWVWT